MDNFAIKIGVLIVIVAGLVVGVKILSSSSSDEQIKKVDVVQTQKPKPAPKPKVVKPRDIPVQDSEQAEPDSSAETQTPEESTQPDAPQPVQEITDEAERLEADRILERVVYEYGMGRKINTYKKVVDACRELFERYPNSPQAIQAREYLRKIPASFRNNYRITKEELGFDE